jgi:urea transport system permease protein
VPDGTDSVPLNNSVRSALQTFHAAAGLHAVESTSRLAAVKAIQDAANPALLPLLQKQLQVEREDSVRDALRLAAATLQLGSPSTTDKLAAIAIMGDASDPALLTLLEPLAANPQENSDVRRAADEAIASIKATQFSYNLLGHLFSGASLGSILLLAALGLAITYGLLGVINMAHGEMLMLGAYTTWLIQNLFRQYSPAAFDYYLLAALPAAFVVTAIIGMALERLVIRHLYGRPLETLLATWGISLMLMQAVRVAFGAQNVEVANPSWLSGGIALTTTLTLPYNRLAIIAFVAAVLVLTWLLLNRTRLGLFVRAVTQNRRMADSVGVPTGRVDMLAFGLGSGIAGLGGVALSQIGNVGPDLGQSYIIDSFMVVVLGGVGQLAGTVAGALGLGMLAKVIEPSLGAVLAKILILVFIILFIQKRPQGLFALKGRVLD